jgi:hypothetical protein
VLVRPVHLDAVIVVGDVVTASGAHERAPAGHYPVAHRFRRRSAVSLSIEQHETSVE